MTRTAAMAGAGALALVLLGSAGWWWQRQSVPNLVAVPLPERAVAPAPPSEPATTVAPAAANPDPATAATTQAPTAAPLAAKDLHQALVALLGAKAVREWLHLEDFAHRFVATVDNLGRAHAPSLLWPIAPTPGRFAVIEHEGRTVIDPDNQRRYTPFVQWFEGVDSAAAADLYVRMSPVLQQAYEALGFPGQRFDARLLRAIDELIASPDAPDLVEVTLTEVRGPIPSSRPWVRYEFADPTLESATAGDKLMVRVGAPNQSRLKAKLRELRAALAARMRR